ncbi:neutral zinc metallopeptidase [Candidatus Gracilibacteria bacterium]|nr:neutral zinc metallopeptidase [Candidatus Gracilibacteria bacterium]
MAKWDQISETGNVEDRRGMRTAGVVGGMSVTGLIIVLAVGYFGGPEQALNVLNQLQQGSQNQTTTVTHEYDGVDPYEKFVGEVLGSTNTIWSKAFEGSQKGYQPPKLVLFRDATTSGCGGATSEIGPHYCNIDQTIYLDERFFDELTKRFGARGGDVAQGYVIAHEVAHHLQDQLGTLSTINSLMQRNPARQNELSIALELQADCYAGIWAGMMQGKGIIEPEEISQAIDAASAVGDDRIQKATTGQINPETWTHGSSADRKKWFTTGYTEKSVASCDTFGAK